MGSCSTRVCGWTLARAHAQSGDPVAVAEYPGESDAFDKSITDLSQRYADQNERDYQEAPQMITWSVWVSIRVRNLTSSAWLWSGLKPA